MLMKGVPLPVLKTDKLHFSIILLFIKMLNIINNHKLIILYYRTLYSSKIVIND